MHLFDEVAELIRAMAPEELGAVHLRAHRRGVKVWFGQEAPPKEHYEAQVLARRHVDGKPGVTVEIGFHSEYPNRERNEDVIAALLDHEHEWRHSLGDEAEAGMFYGSDNWTRISEAWIEPDLDDPELAFELASRTVDYVTAIEPQRSSRR